LAKTQTLGFCYCLILKDVGVSVAHVALVASHKNTYTRQRHWL